jgi:hypothetical protein
VPAAAAAAPGKKVDKYAALPSAISMPSFDIGTAPHKPRELIDFELRMPPDVREEFQKKVRQR